MVEMSEAENGTLGEACTFEDNKKIINQ